MPLEPATTIATLNSANPLDSDLINAGDDHIRLIKNVLKNAFPGQAGNGFASPITVFESQLNDILPCVDNITALKAQPKLGARVVRTRGYTTANDGGDGFYWLDVADTTSTDNGGTIIVATDGGRWKLNSKSNIISAAQFGCLGGLTINTTKLQEAINATKVLIGPPVLDLNGLKHTIDAPLVINNGDMIITNGTLSADSTFVADGTGSKALLRLHTGLRITVCDIKFECAFLSDGVECESGGFGNIYERLEVNAGLNYGIKINAASSGDQKIVNCLLTQSQGVAAKRTGVGIQIDAGDIKLFNNTVRFWGKNLVFTAGTPIVSNCHFYNGNSGIDTPLTNSINIEISGGNGHTFIGNYIDKGRIILKGAFSSHWVGNRYLFDSVPVHDSVFVFDAVDTVGATFNSSFVHIGSYGTVPVTNGLIPFIQFTASGTGSWDTNSSAIQTLAQAYGSTIKVLGNGTSEVINALGKQFIKADSTSSITFDGNGVTNKPRLLWDNKEISFQSSGQKLRTVGTGTLSTGTATVEGSRTGSTGSVAVMKFCDRRGSSDTTLDDTALGFYQFNMYAASSTNPGTLRLERSDPASATVTEDFRFSSTAFLPGATNLMSIGSSANNFLNMYSQNIVLKPPSSVTPVNNLEMTFELTSDSLLKIKVKGSDGIVRTNSLTLTP